MYSEIGIAPSILSADFMNMQHDVEVLEQGGATWIHVDVMDGHFVPNLTIGVPFVKQLKQITKLPLDVHLMISNPLEQLQWYIDAGSDIVTMHLEAFDNDDDVRKALKILKEAGVKSSLALKPKTPVAKVKPFIADVDMVLVMSVEPGFSGQSYIFGSELKVSEVAMAARQAQATPLIEVDGGVGEKTIAMLAAAGADRFVCGNAVCGADDPADALLRIQCAGEYARRSALGY